MPLEISVLRDLARSEPEAAAALTRRLHDVLIKAQPQHASYEDAQLWAERILGKGPHIDLHKGLLPELHIAAIGKKIGSAEEAIHALIYSEYHPRSATAQSQYLFVDPTLPLSEKALIRQELSKLELRMLDQAAFAPGDKLAGVFEQVMGPAPAARVGKPVNIHSYVSPPYFNYGGSALAMEGALPATLNVVEKGPAVTPQALRGFIEDHARYNTTLTSKELAARSPEWAQVEEQVSAIEKGERSLFSRINRESGTAAGRG